MRFGDALRSVVFDEQRGRRETVGNGMIKTLLDMGLSAPEAQGAANKFIMNGLVDLPTKRNRTLKPGKDIQEGADPDVPVHSTLEDIKYDPRKKKRAYLLMDQGTGQHSFITPPPGMDDADDIEQLNYNSVHPQPQPRAEPEDPVTALYKKIVENYNKNSGELDKSGNPKGVTDQDSANFKAAADALGLPYEERSVPREPGFLDKVRNLGASATQKLPSRFQISPAKPGTEKLPPTLVSPQQKLATDVQRAKDAILHGFVKKDEAQRRLERRWGKKDFGLPDKPAK